MNIKKKLADIERQLEEVKASLKKEDRIYVPDSIKIYKPGNGILNGKKLLHYKRSHGDWAVDITVDEFDATQTMKRPYLEKAEELEVGKVYAIRHKICASVPVSYLSEYRLYLGSNKFVHWVGQHIFEVSAMPRDFYFYAVKDEA